MSVVVNYIAFVLAFGSAVIVVANYINITSRYYLYAFLTALFGALVHPIFGFATGAAILLLATRAGGGGVFYSTIQKHPAIIALLAIADGALLASAQKAILAYAALLDMPREWLYYLNSPLNMEKALESPMPPDVRAALSAVFTAGSKHADEAARREEYRRAVKAAITLIVNKQIEQARIVTTVILLVTIFVITLGFAFFVAASMF